MPIVPLFRANQEGKSVVSTAQRHLNLYAEIDPDAEKSRLIFHGTPGLILRAGSSLGNTPIRGWIAAGDLYYLVHQGTFYEVNNAGAKTSRGTVSTTTGRVDLAYNGSVVVLTVPLDVFAPALLTS